MAPQYAFCGSSNRPHCTLLYVCLEKPHVRSCQLSKVLRSRIQCFIVCRMVLTTHNIMKKSKSEARAEIGNCAIDIEISKSHGLIKSLLKQIPKTLSKSQLLSKSLTKQIPKAWPLSSRTACPANSHSLFLERSKKFETIHLSILQNIQI